MPQLRPALRLSGFYSVMKNASSPAISALPLERHHQKTLRLTERCYVAATLPPKLRVVAPRRDDRTLRRPATPSAACRRCVFPSCPSSPSRLSRPARPALRGRRRIRAQIPRDAPQAGAFVDIEAPHLLAAVVG